MPQKEKLNDQWVRLREIKGWLAEKMYQEDDRQVRDTLFAASQAIGLAMLNLESVEYETNGAYNQEDR